MKIQDIPWVREAIEQSKATLRETPEASRPSYIRTMMLLDPHYLDPSDD